MKASFNNIKRIVTGFIKDLNLQADQTPKSQQDINFLKPKLDYQKAGK